MGKLIKIDNSIYEQDCFIQEPLMCLPTCLSVIFKDISDNLSFNLSLKPFEILKLGLITYTFSFKVNNYENYKYFLDNYYYKFEINENNFGC